MPDTVKFAGQNPTYWFYRRRFTENSYLLIYVRMEGASLTALYYACMSIRLEGNILGG